MSSPSIDYSRYESMTESEIIDKFHEIGYYLDLRIIQTKIRGIRYEASVSLPNGTFARDSADNISLKMFLISLMVTCNDHKARIAEATRRLHDELTRRDQEAVNQLFTEFVTRLEKEGRIKVIK